LLLVGIDLDEDEIDDVWTNKMIWTQWQHLDVHNVNSQDGFDQGYRRKCIGNCYVDGIRAFVTLAVLDSEGSIVCAEGILMMGGVLLI
jgi:hypothetical protein